MVFKVTLNGLIQTCHLPSLISTVCDFASSSYRGNADVFQVVYFLAGCLPKTLHLCCRVCSVPHPSLGNLGTI